jgi:HlyD family secretion protein
MFTPKRAAITSVLVALMVASALALRPAPLVVEAVPASRGLLRVIVEGSGRTRVRDRYVVAAPIAGHLERVSITEGDVVQAGDAVARMTAATPAPLDTRARAELRGRLAAARAAEAQARAAVERARHAADLAASERDRVRALVRGGSLAPRDLDQAESTAEERAHEIEMAESASRQALAEAVAVAAALTVRAGPGGNTLQVRSPARGRVLRILQESEAPVLAGTPLLEIGDPTRIEVRVDLLSTDAVRVQPGAQAEVTHWGGDGVLRGKVRRVEPSAFTKVSALGIEEQRVYVLVDPVGEGWGALGDGFSVEASIVVSERHDVVQVPAGALFRREANWATFIVERGRASLRIIRTGATSSDATEITDGIVPGQLVILHPSDQVEDGARIQVVR